MSQFTMAMGSGMMDRPWWSHVIQWGAWFAIMSVTVGWLSWSRQRRHTSKDRNVLEYPHSQLIVGVVCSGFFLTLTVLSLLYPNTTGSPLISSLFFGFSCAGAYLIAQFFYVRHRLEPSGLQYRTLVCGHGFLRWGDVVRIRYSKPAKWFRVDGAGGEAIRLSAMLLSLPEFARAVLQAVPRGRIDPDTFDVLEATAAGSLPPLWG